MTGWLISRHEVHNVRVLDALKHMPPSDEEIGELWARLLDDEIQKVPA